MSLLFVTYGPTHSGKTTFGKKLREALGETAKFIHLDNDVVDEFIKANYNNLRTDKDILATRTPSNPDLRLLIPQFIAGYALKENYSVIATAAHPKKVIRQKYYDIAKENNAQVVLVMFRINDEQAMERIRKNKRDDAILDVSPHGGTDFEDLFQKQKGVLEEPDEAEKNMCFKVLEITPDNAEEKLAEAADLTRKG